MDEQQHKDGYPWTWEPAAAVLLGLACIAVLAIQLGRSTALMVTGSGTWWPAPEHLLGSTWAITQGNLTAGLPNTITHTPQTELAWILAAMFAAALCGGAGWLLMRLRARSTGRGMATPEQATQLLGLTRLHKHRRIIRPDLYARRTP